MQGKTPNGFGLKLTATIMVLVILPFSVVALVAGAADTRSMWLNWIVSNGTLEAGGRLFVKGFPPLIVSDQSYIVDFTFYVDTFDWGSSIRPRSVEWFVGIGCISQGPLTCTRNDQNLTLGVSPIDGNYSIGEGFRLATTWRLTLAPMADRAFLGVKIPAKVECWDTARCLPHGESVIMTRSYLNPETLVPLRGVEGISSSIIIWIWPILAATGVALAFGLLLFRAKRKRIPL